MQIFSWIAASIWLLPKRAEAKTIDEIINVVKAEIVNPLIGFMMVVAAVVFLYGVVEFIMGSSAGETSSSGSISYKSRAKGKQHIVWGLIGLAIMISVQAIIQVFQNFFSSIR